MRPMNSAHLKVTIICGCLEPGADGVGDYSRILADGAQALGHSIQLISIADNCNKVEHVGSLTIHRFKDVLNDPSRMNQVTRLIEETTPDWLSLQFVNFSFNPRGLLNKLIPAVDTWRRGRRLHIMFHECYLEKRPLLAIKHNILARIQKGQTRKAARHWQPDCIHTSNPYYAAQLQTVEIEAKQLPLLSNIPIYPVEDNQEGACFLESLTAEPIFLFPFTQHREWSPRPVMLRLKQLAEAKCIVPQILQIGKNQYQAKHWPVIQAEAKAYGWKHLALGSQSDAVISALLQTAQLGITTKHVLIAGKSGAVQAMREHDLPIFFSEPAPNTQSQKSTAQPPLFLPWELSNEALASGLDFKRKRKPKAMPQTICQKWIEDIQNAPKANAD